MSLLAFINWQVVLHGMAWHAHNVHHQMEHDYLHEKRISMVQRVLTVYLLIVKHVGVTQTLNASNACLITFSTMQVLVLVSEATA